MRFPLQISSKTGMARQQAKKISSRKLFYKHISHPTFITLNDPNSDIKFLVKMYLYYVCLSIKKWNSLLD